MHIELSKLLRGSIRPNRKATQFRPNRYIKIPIVQLHLKLLHFALANQSIFGNEFLSVMFNSGSNAARTRCKPNILRHVPQIRQYVDTLALASANLGLRRHSNHAKSRSPLFPRRRGLGSAVDNCKRTAQVHSLCQDD